MSRNFDLLTQIDRQAGATAKPMPDLAHRSVAAETVPIFPAHGENASGEEMLRLVQRIFLSANGSAPRQVVLCGVDPENGSSSVCASAGRTLAANSSRPVCLVDANVNSPRLSRILGVEASIPLSATPAPSCDQCVKIDTNLWLAGPSLLADSSRVLLPVDQLEERLARLRDVFEYLLIDAPGIRVCGDAEQLGHVAGAVILVVEASSTRRQAARNAKDALDAAGVRLLGSVLHNRSFPIPGKLYKRL